MKTASLTIDRAGRLVIPKRLRDQYGFSSGMPVVLKDTGTGVLITPDMPARRLVKHGKVTAIDTGGGTADATAFDLELYRDERLGAVAR